MAWRKLASGGVDICVVPGADSGLPLAQPHVQSLAEQFRIRPVRAPERQPPVSGAPARAAQEAIDL